MLRTYSRKLRPAPNGDSVVELYKSSQDSFFDSPNDPYFFDSQTSTTEDTQLQHSNHSSAALAATAEATQLHKICSNQIQSPTAQDSSAASSSRVTQLSAQTAVPLPELPLKRKSRLSQCSSQPLQDDSAATVKANPPTVQAPILPQLMHVKQAIAPQTIVRDSGTTSQVCWQLTSCIPCFKLHCAWQWCLHTITASLL